jgi:AsmA family protein
MMWRRWLLAIGVLLLAAILLQPLWLAPLVGRQLTQSSGRAVHFDRMWLSLSSALQPVVQWRGIRIDNAPCADSRRPFAALASATAVISWRSIEQRRPVIELMVLRDGEVDLERSADGLRNWRLSNPEYRGPGRYKVLALQAERASLRFRHEGADLDMRASAAPIGAASGAVGSAAAAASPLTTRIEIDGEWRRLPFKVSAATGPALTFLETGRTFPLQGSITAGGARLDVDGRLGDIVREPLADARVAIAAPSLAPLAAFIDSPRRHPRPRRAPSSRVASMPT